MKIRTFVLRLVAVSAAAAILSAPLPSQASETKEASSDFGIGMVTVLANVAYMPVKVVYGVMGGITGGFTYVLSGANREAADAVWVPSLGGDYVLTTEHMTGRDRVHFNGVRERSYERRDVASEDLGGNSTF